MTLTLFNTLGRKLEVFKPIKDNQVGIYSCGPTVYWYQHIGNLRSYIFADILKRVLIYNKFKVKHVMNWTDVGHLTSDADIGEDKMELAVKREHKTAKEIANYYGKVFESDCKKLNILKANMVCKATEHIKEQIELIKILEKKGFTYKTNDGIYFDTSKFKDYGKLALLNIEGLEAGKRIEQGEKRNKTDFALWKFSEEPGIRQQEWNPKDYGTDFPIGFPGWHIECSAMSSKYLGNQFDIHTGGEDHIPIHHTNEIAQSEAAFGKKPWVKYWMHGAFLTFKGEKVSKSKGGLYTISELEEKGYSPLDFRYLCLLTHYRKNLEFSLESLDAAKQAFSHLKNKIIELKKSKEGKLFKNTKNNYKNQFEEAINDDLNVPKALGIAWELLKDEKLVSKEKLGLLSDFDKILGLNLNKVKEEKISIPKEIKELVKKREQARKNKDFRKADEIRNQIARKGFTVEDTNEGAQVRKLLS